MSAAPQVPAQSPTPRLVAGRYRLGARRGTNIDAALFEAFDEELQRPVVVKLMHPDTSARPDVQAEFRTAMDQAGSLHHPNIAVAHSWGITDWNGHRVLFLVSEQLTGGSVRDMLDRGRLLTPSQALLVGLDVCKALDVIHRKGLVHGDIRPGTLVFGDDRRLRVVDVGLSQVLAFADDNVHRSNDLAKYASPEQAQGEPPQAKSDVYSLCLTLFETLTGTVPFMGDSTVATLANRVDRLLPVSADLGALASVLERAGRPDPADRYTAAEFGRALVQAAERLPRPAPLPILANSLFGIDPATPGDLTDPTGVLRAPLMAAAAAAAVATDDHAPADLAATEPMPVVPAAVAPAPAPTEVLPAADAVPTTAVPTTAVPTTAVPTTAVPAAAVAATTAAAVVPPPPAAPAPAVPPADDFDPRDEFPEHPPAPGHTRRWLILALLLLACAGGALAWYNSRPEMRTVPALAGMEEGVALNAIAGDFQGVLAQESSETVDAGHIIRTDPAEGIEAEKGTSVTLFVSTGPAPRVLPELAGKTVADATDELEGLGLVVEVGDPEFDETVAKDTVLSWTVPDSPTLVAGGTVTKGTAVRLIASAGPAPRTVPDLTGKPLADATKALADLQLVIAQGPDEYSDTIPAGQVARQDTAPGGTLDRGGKVTVIVSKGHAPITMPTSLGVPLNKDAIAGALKKLGFGTITITGDPTTKYLGLKVDGKPVYAGQQYPWGSAIEVVFAATPPPSSTP